MIHYNKKIHEVLRCDTCGKITSFKEMKKNGGASWVFVPGSDVSIEENYFRCKICTDNLGKLEPSQNVVNELCSGIY